MRIFSVFFLFFAIQIALKSNEFQHQNLRTLIDFVDSTKADELLISYKGETICHWQRTNYNLMQIDSNNLECRSKYMGTASMVKSWTGIIVGILIDKGYIKSIDDPICNYLPEWNAGCEGKVTIRHLLTMSAGIKRLGGRGILSKSNQNEYALKLKLDTLPNIKFEYSNESVQLLGILIEKVTKKDVLKVFKEYLFEPLNIDSTTFSKDSAGNYIVYGGCKTTVANAMKIGKMMLNYGVYNDKQIVSKEWVIESTKPSLKANFYGLLWWLDNNSKYRNYAASGDLGQMTIVFPDLNLVVVRRQSCDLSASSREMNWMGPHFLEMLYKLVME